MALTGLTLFKYLAWGAAQVSHSYSCVYWYFEGLDSLEALKALASGLFCFEL